MCAVYIGARGVWFRYAGVRLYTLFDNLLRFARVVFSIIPEQIFRAPFSFQRRNIGADSFSYIERARVLYYMVVRAEDGMPHIHAPVYIYIYIFGFIETRSDW